MGWDCLCETSPIPQTAHEWIRSNGGKILAGENWKKNRRIKCLWATLSTTNQIWDDLDVNPGLRVKNPELRSGPPDTNYRSSTRVFIMIAVWQKTYATEPENLRKDRCNSNRWRSYVTTVTVNWTMIHWSIISRNLCDCLMFMLIKY